MNGYLREGNDVKDYQDLIGKVILAVAIVIAGGLFAQAIRDAGFEIARNLSGIGELIRDGLLQVGSAS